MYRFRGFLGMRLGFPVPLPDVYNIFRGSFFTVFMGSASYGSCKIPGLGLRLGAPVCHKVFFFVWYEGWCAGHRPQVWSHTFLDPG